MKYYEIFFKLLIKIMFSIVKFEYFPKKKKIQFEEYLF